MLESFVFESGRGWSALRSAALLVSTWITDQFMPGENIITRDHILLGGLVLTAYSFVKTPKTTFEAPLGSIFNIDKGNL